MGSQSRPPSLSQARSHSQSQLEQSADPPPLPVFSDGHLPYDFCVRSLRRRLWKAAVHENHGLFQRLYQANEQDFAKMLEAEIRLEWQHFHSKFKHDGGDAAENDRNHPLAKGRGHTRSKPSRINDKRRGRWGNSKTHSEDDTTSAYGTFRSRALACIPNPVLAGHSDTPNPNGRSGNATIAKGEKSAENDANSGPTNAQLWSSIPKGQSILEYAFSPSEPFVSDDFKSPYDTYEEENVDGPSKGQSVKKIEADERRRQRRLERKQRLERQRASDRPRMAFRNWLWKKDSERHFDDEVLAAAAAAAVPVAQNDGSTIEAAGTAGQRNQADDAIDATEPAQSLDNENDVYWTTPLHEAARLGSSPLLQYLLNRPVDEADPNIKNGRGRTVLHMVSGGVTKIEAEARQAASTRTSTMSGAQKERQHASEDATTSSAAEKPAEAGIGVPLVPPASSESGDQMRKSKSSKSMGGRAAKAMGRMFKSMRKTPGPKKGAAMHDSRKTVEVDPLESAYAVSNPLNSTNGDRVLASQVLQNLLPRRSEAVHTVLTWQPRASCAASAAATASNGSEIDEHHHLDSGFPPSQGNYEMGGNGPPSINAVDRLGRTALHYAAETGRSDVCWALLSSTFGVLLTIVDEVGARTPCELAALHGYQELAAQLEARALLYTDPYGLEDEYSSDWQGGEDYGYDDHGNYYIYDAYQGQISQTAEEILVRKRKKLSPPFNFFATLDMDQVDLERQRRLEKARRHVFSYIHKWNSQQEARKEAATLLELTVQHSMVEASNLQEKNSSNDEKQSKPSTASKRTRIDGVGVGILAMPDHNEEGDCETNKTDDVNAETDDVNAKTDDVNANNEICDGTAPEPEASTKPPAVDSEGISHVDGMGQQEQGGESEENDQVAIAEPGDGEERSGSHGIDSTRENEAKNKVQSEISESASSAIKAGDSPRQSKQMSEIEACIPEVTKQPPPVAPPGENTTSSVDIVETAGVPENTSSATSDNQSDDELKMATSAAAAAAEENSQVAESHCQIETDATTESVADTVTNSHKAGIDKASHATDAPQEMKENDADKCESKEEQESPKENIDGDSNELIVEPEQDLLKDGSGNDNCDGTAKQVAEGDEKQENEVDKFGNQEENIHDHAESPAGAEDQMPVQDSTPDELKYLDNLQNAHLEQFLAFHKWKNEAARDGFKRDLFNSFTKASVDLPSIRRAGQSMEEENSSTCLICYDDEVSSSEWFRLQGCVHGFCRPCLKEYLADCAGAKNTGLSIPCPHHECASYFTTEEITALLEDNPEHHSRIVEAANEKFVTAAYDMRFCPHPGCNGIVRRLPQTAFNSLGPDLDLLDCLGAVCTAGSTSTSGLITLTYEGVMDSEYNNCQSLQQPAAAHRFCFSCGEGVHWPVPCERLEKWKEKVEEEIGDVDGNVVDPNDVSAVAQKLWLKANTRPCPRCNVPIEKNDGCNHMTCTNQSCNHEFCWICRKDWKLHGTSTGGFFRCNIWSGDDADGAGPQGDSNDEHLQAAATPARANEQGFINGDNNEQGYGTAIHSARAAYRKKREMDRFLHHYTRWNAHAESARLERKMSETSSIRLAPVVDAAVEFDGNAHFNFGGKGLSFVHSAFTELLECRSVLQHSYAFSYFRYPSFIMIRRYGQLSQIRREKASFEKLQSELETMTEQMSDIVARSHLRASQFQICFLTKGAAEKRQEFSNLMLSILVEERKEERADMSGLTTADLVRAAARARERMIASSNLSPSTVSQMVDDIWSRNDVLGVPGHQIRDALRSSLNQYAEGSDQQPRETTLDVAPADSAAQMWSCAACTYMNSNGGRRCAMCGTAR